MDKNSLTGVDSLPQADMPMFKDAELRQTCHQKSWDFAPEPASEAERPGKRVRLSVANEEPRDRCVRSNLVKTIGGILGLQEQSSFSSISQIAMLDPPSWN